MILDYTAVHLAGSAAALRAALIEFCALNSPAVFAWACPACGRSGRVVVFAGDDLAAEVTHEHHRPQTQHLPSYRPCYGAVDEIRVHRWTLPTLP